MVTRGSSHGPNVCPSSPSPLVGYNDHHYNTYRDTLARDSRDLAVPPGKRLEMLHGDREGQHSIRVNARLRVCFRWEDGDAYDVEITDYH